MYVPIFSVPNYRFVYIYATTAYNKKIFTIDIAMDGWQPVSHKQVQVAENLDGFPLNLLSPDNWCLHRYAESVVGSNCKSTVASLITMQLIYRELDAEIVRRTNSIFPAQDCFVEVLPDHVIIPRKYCELGESIRELPIFEDDVWMVSYPRTGSTWAQEMVWLLGHKLDYEAAKQDIRLRAPMIELSALFSTDHHEWVANAFGNTVDMVRNLPRPRFARSHLSWNLLPEQFDSVKPKIVYTARNPKDLCVSYYHYCKLLHGINGNFEQFVELFLDGHTPMGSYWQHVLPFWKRSFDDNVLFIKYEDMIRDLPAVVRRCSQFLKVPYLLDDTKMQILCDHLQFDSMKGNKAINLEKIMPQKEAKFIRNGKIGDWRNHMTDEMSTRFDVWIEKNLSGTGLSFDYD